MNNKILNIIGIFAVIGTLIWAHNKTKENTMNTGIKLENMNTEIRAGDDFCTYATGGWQKAHPIPDDYVRYGVSEVLYNTNLDRIKQILENDNGKIGTLYKLAMDTDKLTADGTKPVQKYLDAVDAVTRENLESFLGNLHKTTNAFWGDSVELDQKDSEHYLYHIGQAGLGMGRDYFFDTDSKSVEIRQKYKEFITKQTQNFGIDADSEELYALEERMAKSFYPKEKLRDPHAIYHKMTIDEVKEKFTGFDWDKYLQARGTKHAKYININQPEAITEAIAIINDTDIELIKKYLKKQICSNADGLLDEKTYDIAFDFYNRTIAGQKEKKPRWKRAIAITDDALSEEIGKIFVAKYFPEAAKERIQTMVKNLQKAYAQRIENLNWMSDETKQKALKKLSSFKAKIGYPDVWRDYTNLEIKNDSLFENMMRTAEFEDQFWINKIGQERDSTVWYMAPHEINAYYDPSSNEICFPAGILQYPFFDMDTDDAFNYGAIGAVIGHEMTHGFDDFGRNFDNEGNMKDWWTPEDSEKFNQLSTVMKDFFDKIKINDEVNANGTFTLGENLADYGGLTIAYDAYKKFGDNVIDTVGMTPDMRFFIAYAGTWAQNIRDEEALRLTKNDEHSLGKNRINGIVVHIDAWYDAFGIDKNSKMYIAPENRVKLW